VDGLTSTQLLRRLLGPDVEVVEHVGEPGRPTCRELETGLLHGAAPARRDAFARGRQCARQACQALGQRAVMIGLGEDRAPIWPEGIVGSITHTTGYTAAAVSFTHRLGYLGIDAEPALPLPDDVLETVLTAAELDQLNSHRPSNIYGRLVFCAKEAAFKALWPRHRTWLDFHQIEIRFHTDESRFHAHLPGHLALPDLGGRYIVDDTLIRVGVTW
jgi:4'-phosphopantetheinyl transferase EntD